MSIKNISCNISVSSLTYFKGDLFLPPDEVFVLRIDYPLSKAAEFQIKTGAKGMGLGGLLAEIGRAYNKVYGKEDEYGVWGHEMNDLAIEGITVDFTKKTIKLSVGS